MRCWFTCVFAIGSVVSCSPENRQVQVDKWLQYQSEETWYGLNVKPLEITYGTDKLSIGGKLYGKNDAIILIDNARNMSPAPNILLNINYGNQKSAVAFMEEVSEKGLCEYNKCYFLLR